MGETYRRVGRIGVSARRSAGGGSAYRRVGTRGAVVLRSCATGVARSENVQGLRGEINKGKFPNVPRRIARERVPTSHARGHVPRRPADSRHADTSLPPPTRLLTAP